MPGDDCLLMPFSFQAVFLNISARDKHNHGQYILKEIEFEACASVSISANEGGGGLFMAIGNMIPAYTIVLEIKQDTVTYWMERETCQHVHL